MSSTEINPGKAGAIWTLSLDEPSPVITPQVDVTFVRVGPEAIPFLAPVMRPTAPDEIQKRLENGRQCYVGWVDGRIAVYGWVSFNDEFVGELRLSLNLLPDEAYVWDCATLPVYREKYLYSALLVHILSALRTQQICRAWIGANLENEPSHRGIARAGFQRVAAVMIQRVSSGQVLSVVGVPGAPDHLVTAARRLFLNNRDKVWLDGPAAPAEA